MDFYLDNLFADSDPDEVIPDTEDSGSKDQSDDDGSISEDEQKHYADSSKNKNQDEDIPGDEDLGNQDLSNDNDNKEEHEDGHEETLSPLKKRGVFAQLVRTFFTLYIALLFGAAVGLYYMIEEGRSREYIIRRFEAVREYFACSKGIRTEKQCNSEHSPLVQKNGRGYQDSVAPPTKVVVP